MALDPDHRDARERRATTYFHLGRYGETVDDLARAVELAPERPETRLRLAVARLKAGDRPGFERETQALFELELTPKERERAHLVLGAAR